MKIRLLKFIKRVLFGNEISLALTLFKLIAKAFGKIEPGELPRHIYMKLPKHWKAPEGPASEHEFMDVISRGIDFYRSVRRVVT